MQNINCGTFELVPRADSGFVGFDVLNQHGVLVADIGLSDIGNGYLGVSIRDENGEAYGSFFGPPGYKEALKDRIAEAAERIEKLPPNLAAPIEDDVLNQHLFAAYSGAERLEAIDEQNVTRFEKQLEAAEAFMATF